MAASEAITKECGVPFEGDIMTIALSVGDTVKTFLENQGNLYGAVMQHVGMAAATFAAGAGVLPDCSSDATNTNVLDTLVNMNTVLAAPAFQDVLMGVLMQTCANSPSNAPAELMNVCRALFDAGCQMQGDQTLCAMGDIMRSGKIHGFHPMNWLGGTIKPSDLLQLEDSQANVNNVCGIPPCEEGYDPCGICGGDASSCTGACGVLNGDSTTCLDCAGVVNGDKVEDACGVCGGDSTSCEDDCGVPNGSNKCLTSAPTESTAAPTESTAAPTESTAAPTDGSGDGDGSGDDTPPPLEDMIAACTQEWSQCDMPCQMVFMKALEAEDETECGENVLCQKMVDCVMNYFVEDDDINVDGSGSGSGSGEQTGAPTAAQTGAPTAAQT